MFAQEFRDHVRAGFSALWVQTHEHQEATKEIAAVCRDAEWALRSWDVDRGNCEFALPERADGNNDPLAGVKGIASLIPADGRASVLVLVNFHRFIGAADVMQATIHAAEFGKSRSCSLVVLSHSADIPPEVSKLFKVLRFELPDSEWASAKARELVEHNGLNCPVYEGIGHDVAGLTRLEVENEYSLSLVRHATFDRTSLWQAKAHQLAQSSGLRLYSGGESFDHLQGYDGLKRFCWQSLTTKQSRVHPKGVVLFGVPGAGKSYFAKALGSATGRMTVALDLGAMRGSLVGQSEQQIRQALEIVDRLGPVVLFIDEIEKQFAGAASDHVGDGGVAKDQLGTLLQWRSERGQQVYLVATCNDATQLTAMSQGALTRAGRVDAMFYMGAPSRTQKDMIWKLYQKEYDIEEQGLPPDTDWTGAEIEACCQQAALRGITLLEAAESVVPVLRTSAGTVRAMQEWATGRCIDANTGKVYNPNAPAQAARPKQERRLLN